MSDYQPVHRFLEAQADVRGDGVVLVHGEQTVTYGELETRANRLAAALRQRGVVRGDRVALLAENGHDYLVGFFGILKAGAAAVALNHANKVRTQRQLLADSGAVALVTCLAQVRRELPDLVVGLEDLRLVVVDRRNPTWHLPPRFGVLDDAEVATYPDHRDDAGVRPADLCAILYTSGSTGLPRGVTLTHGNLAANTAQILAYLPLTADDSVLVVLPFHYSYGNSLLLTHVKTGGRLVVDNRFAFPQTVLETLVRAQVSGFAGVPSTYAILAAKTAFLTTPLPHLRYITQAGGAMAPTLTRRLRESLPARTEVFVMYGQTEASARLAYVPPERLLEKLGSIGVAIPGVTLTLQRPDGGECEPGEVGEIVASGDNIMQGYWNDPAETALVLQVDGLHTGDLARRDADGFLTIVDRLKNMIKVGANRVSAKEIEETMAELPEVVEACVVGVPDALLGEAVEAFVVLRDGRANPRRILAHLRENLALFKVPRGLHLVEALPKTGAGKIDKQALRARVVPAPGGRAE